MSVNQAIGVKVTFALSKKPPFGAGATSPTTPVQTVLAEAMDYFGAKPEPNTEYYLVAHGERQPGNRTVGEVAGEAHEVVFGLRKEITNG